MDLLTTQADIDNVSLEAIAAFTQAELIAKPGLIGTVTDLSALVGPGMQSVKVPRFNSFVAQTKVAATKLAAQKLTSSPDTLSLDKNEAVYTMIEDIAQLQSSVDMQQLYGERCASALMKKWDANVYAELITGASTSFSAGSALTKADFTKARKLLRDSEVDLSSGGSWLAIDPSEEKVIMDLSDFVDADKFASGSEAIKVNGFIGRAYGFNIVVSTQYTSPVFYHSSAVAFARQKALSAASQFNVGYLATELAIWHVYGVKQMQGGVASVKFA